MTEQEIVELFSSFEGKTVKRFELVEFKSSEQNESRPGKFLEGRKLVVGFTDGSTVEVSPGWRETVFRSGPDGHSRTDALLQAIFLGGETESG